MRAFILFSILFCLQSVAEAKPLKLVLNWKPEPEFGGFYTAQIEGIYKKKNLDVEIVPGGAGTPTIQMAAAGQADFAIVAGEELVISWARKTGLVPLFAVYQTNPVAIMAHKERGFNSLKDVFLSDGTVAIQKGLPFYTYLEKKFGKPKAKIVPLLGGITNFINSPNYSQQIFIFSEPLQAAHRGIATQDFLVADEGFNPYLTVVVARKAFIDKNPDTVKAMVASIREGWKMYLEQPEKTNAWMAKLNPAMSLKDFNEISKAHMKYIQPPKGHELGSMTRERWETLAKQSQELGLVKEQVTPQLWAP